MERYPICSFKVIIGDAGDVAVPGLENPKRCRRLKMILTGIETVYFSMQLEPGQDGFTEVIASCCTTKVHFFDN